MLIAACGLSLTKRVHSHEKAIHHWGHYRPYFRRLNDPRLADPTKKEPLARLALSYAGADQQADEFYITAINDMGLTMDQRINYIEDINEDGFLDRKNLSAADLPLIENRLALIEQLAPSAAVEANAAAFKEAHKYLVNMRDWVMIPPSPPK